MSILRRAGRLCAALMIAALASGCVSVSLVSDYDPQIDAGLTTLYGETSAFVDEMVAEAGTPAGAYAANQGFYRVSAGKIAALTARAEANKALDHCPSTKLLSRAARSHVSSEVRQTLDRLSGDDCQVVLFTLLKDNFEQMRRFHEAQGAAGIPASARGPLLDGGVGAIIRAGLVVEAAKKADQSVRTKP